VRVVTRLFLAVLLSAAAGSSASADPAPPALVGFRAAEGRATVVVRGGAELAVRSGREAGSTRVFHVEGVKARRRVDRLPLDVRGFEGPVSLVEVKRTKEGVDVVVHLSPAFRGGTVVGAKSATTAGDASAGSEYLIDVVAGQAGAPAAKAPKAEPEAAPAE
jgi:hypothetical protein